MKILLAVDGSEPSLTAVSLVSALSLPAGSAIELLTVIADEPLTYGPWPASAPIQTPALDRTYSDVRARIDDIAAGLD